MSEPGSLPALDSGSRGRNPKRLAIAALVLVAIAAATFVAISALGGEAEAQVVLRPLGSTRGDAFGPSFAPAPSSTLSDFAENGPPAGSVLASAALAAASLGTIPDGSPSPYRSIEGAVPGVFGGSLDEQVCDIDQLVSYLGGDPEKAQAWATALGLDAADIAGYAAELTGANLGSDTRVLEHGFAAGALAPRQVVLQRGTAVLVDARGVPRVDCYSGNPLRNPTIDAEETFVGTAWAAFAESSVLVIEPAPFSVTEFVLFDVIDGEGFTRPIGSTGEADVSSREPEPDQPVAPEPTSEPEPTATPGVTRDLSIVGEVDVNTTIIGEIAQSQDELIYNFDAPNGAKLLLEVANDRASIATIGFELRTGGESLGFFRVPAGGTESFALTLDNDGGGPFEVLVTQGPAAFEFVVGAEIQDDAGQGRDAGDEFGEALEVSSGEQVTGHIAGLDVGDAYVLELRDAPALVFTARADRESGRPGFDLQHLGERLTFFRVNPADENTYELLLGPDDRLLEVYVTEGPSEYGFVAELIPQNDGGQPGDASAELAEARVLETLDGVTGEVGDRDVGDYYLFAGPADTFTVTVEASTQSRGRIGVDVLGPDGVRIGFFRVAPGASGSLDIEGVAGDSYRLILTEGRGEYSISAS